MGELIHANFIEGRRASADEVNQSFTFNRAVETIVALGVDHPMAQEAMSFLTDDEKLEAQVNANDRLSPDAS